jgi:hypothetical protein
MSPQSSEIIDGDSRQQITTNGSGIRRILVSIASSIIFYWFFNSLTVFLNKKRSIKNTLLSIKERVVGKNITRRSDRGLIGDIGNFFHEDFSRVTFRTEGFLRYVIPFPFIAIVFGETVFVRSGSESVLNNPYVMAEELYHVVQWRRLGWSRLPIRYLFYHIRSGYENNPIEREAKSKALSYVRQKKGG